MLASNPKLIKKQLIFFEKSKILIKLFPIMKLKKQCLLSKIDAQYLNTVGNYGESAPKTSIFVYNNNRKHHFVKFYQPEINMLNPIQSKIHKISQESSGVYRVEVKVSHRDTPMLVYNPGQFYFLGSVGIGEAVFSPVRSDVDRGVIVFLVRQVGRVTNWISTLKSGDQIEMRGPLGNGFPIEEMKGHDIILASGGCGVPPIASLAEYILKKPNDFGKIYFLYGARAPQDLHLQKDMEAWTDKIEKMFTIDKSCAGWSGNVGFVSDLIKKIKIDPEKTKVALCGPPMMFKAIQVELNKRGVKDDSIYASLERKMECGIGKCQHCTCGQAYVCIDGPVFRLSEIDVNAT